MVDAANVVGSRPDGWWRDRAGAAARLHARVLADPPAYDEVVLVLEGTARTGITEGTQGPVRTVHAAGHGDDAIVAAAAAGIDRGAEVTVVTSDRALRARVRARGCLVVGPSALGP